MEAHETPALYGVLGYPAGHSLSPAMQQAAFDHFGIRAAYHIFEVRPDELNAFLKDASNRGISGFNVTIPYKEQIIPLLDYVSPDARLVGAVNTVKVRSGRLEGFSTDGQGFMADLAARGVDPVKKKICVIGAGGASRSVCFALARSAPRELAVFNRDIRKAAHLVDHLREHFPSIAFRHADSVDALDIPGAEILVNATSVGMKPDDPELVEERFLHEGLFVYDLVYAPAQTGLLKAAAGKGCRAANGLGMLLFQGMFSFEIWTGHKPPKEIMEAALNRAIAKA